MLCCLHGAQCPLLHYAFHIIPRHPSLCEFRRDAAFSSYLVSRINVWSVKRKAPFKRKRLQVFLTCQRTVSVVWITSTNRARGNVCNIFLPGNTKFILWGQASKEVRDRWENWDKRMRRTFKVSFKESLLAPSTLLKLVLRVSLSNLKIIKLRGQGQKETVLDAYFKSACMLKRQFFCCLCALRFITYSMQSKPTHSHFFNDLPIFSLFAINLKTFLCES